MAAITKIDAELIGAKARTIFSAKIEPHVPPSARSEFVLIDVNSGAYEIGKDDIELEERLLARYPEALMVLLRADGGPTGHFGWPMTEE